MNKFISVFEYAKSKNTSPQNVYRWIREGKLGEENVKLEIRQVERIRVKKDAELAVDKKQG